MQPPARNIPLSLLSGFVPLGGKAYLGKRYSGKGFD